MGCGAGLDPPAIALGQEAGGADQRLAELLGQAHQGPQLLLQGGPIHLES